MYNSKEIIEQITYNLNLIRLNIESFNKLSLYDLNIYSEDFFCKLLNVVFDYNLENLNSKDKNTVSIDLGDTQQRVCFQVTSSNDREKIQNTIDKFEQYKLYDSYDDLYILILKNKGNYKKSFTTNNKYRFSKDNIIDLNLLINDIKSKDLKIQTKAFEIINQNINKFKFLKEKQENSYTTDIDSLILEKKELAREKYNLTIEVVKMLKEELRSRTHKRYLSNENIKKVHSIVLLFQSIPNTEIEKMSYFIRVYPNQLIHALWKFNHHYNHGLFKEELEIDSYLFENIERIVENLFNILDSKVHVSISTGSGTYQNIVNKEYLVASITNSNSKDNKLIFLDIKKENNLGYFFSLGGITENVTNIKKFLYKGDVYYLARSQKHIYIWDIQKSNSHPISIKLSEGEISDYEAFEIDNEFCILAVSNENSLWSWKVIGHIVIQTSKKINLYKSAYIVVNYNDQNHIITNDRYAKTIYTFNIVNNELTLLVTIPEKYHHIVSLDIHPFKNQIAFSYSIPDSDDPLKIAYRVYEFENLAVIDIDKNCELLRMTEQGHFFEKVSYVNSNKNIFLIAYDRDGAGSQFNPMVKSWIEREDKYFQDFIYDNYPREKNTLLDFMKLKNNCLYFYNSDENQISKISNDQEECFYKLDNSYTVSDIL